LNNRYGHPHPWALRYYESVASEVYRTDLDGDVVVTVLPDGTYEVLTERNRAATMDGTYAN
jgi:beta-lactamase superfamily II metal-dependent hydrolase